MNANRNPVPARVAARLERRSSNAAGVHRSAKHSPKGGRAGGRRQAIREQGL